MIATPTSTTYDDSSKAKEYDTMLVAMIVSIMVSGIAYHSTACLADTFTRSIYPPRSDRPYYH